MTRKASARIDDVRAADALCDSKNNVYHLLRSSLRHTGGRSACSCRGAGLSTDIAYLDVWVALHDLFDSSKGESSMFEVGTFCLCDSYLLCPECILELLECEVGIVVGRGGSHKR